MQQRQLGPFTVSAIGLGCMNICHAYGAPVSAEQAERVGAADGTEGAGAGGCGAARADEVVAEPADQAGLHRIESEAGHQHGRLRTAAAIV